MAELWHRHSENPTYLAAPEKSGIFGTVTKASGSQPNSSGMASNFFTRIIKKQYNKVRFLTFTVWSHIRIKQ